MWLYHVPFAICVVSVLKIAFCDKKKSLTIFYLNLFIFEIDNNRKTAQKIVSLTPKSQG
jgi:hypothetical protein